MSVAEAGTSAPTIDPMDATAIIAEVSAMVDDSESQAATPNVDPAPEPTPAPTASEETPDAPALDPASVAAREPGSVVEPEPSTEAAVEATLAHIDSDLKNLEVAIKEASPDITVGEALEPESPAVAEDVSATTAPTTETTPDPTEPAAPAEVPAAVAPEAETAPVDAAQPDALSEQKPTDAVAEPTSPLDGIADSAKLEAEEESEPAALNSDASLTPTAEASAPAAGPAEPVPAGPPRAWYHPLRMARGIAAVLVELLVLLDLPFGWMNSTIKGMIGCAGIATGVIATATWVMIVCGRFHAK
jgi:hypothetical protein